MQHGASGMSSPAGTSRGRPSRAPPPGRGPPRAPRVAGAAVDNPVPSQGKGACLEPAAAGKMGRDKTDARVLGSLHAARLYSL